MSATRIVPNSAEEEFFSQLQEEGDKGTVLSPATGIPSKKYEKGRGLISAAYPMVIRFLFAKTYTGLVTSFGTFAPP